MTDELCECDKPKGHDVGSDFFVSNIRDGKGWRPILGPYKTHDEALANVERGRRLTEEADPRAIWDWFGTCRKDAGSGVVGSLGT